VLFEQTESDRQRRARALDDLLLVLAPSQQLIQLRLQRVAELRLGVALCAGTSQPRLRIAARGSGTTARPEFPQFG